ncbi:MAG: hypothetical protein WC058_03000 [Phycisphaeraceae bacterium]
MVFSMSLELTRLNDDQYAILLDEQTLAELGWTDRTLLDYQVEYHRITITAIADVLPEYDVESVAEVVTRDRSHLR